MSKSNVAKSLASVAGLSVAVHNTFCIKHSAIGITAYYSLRAGKDQGIDLAEYPVIGNLSDGIDWINEQQVELTDYLIQKINPVEPLPDFSANNPYRSLIDQTKLRFTTEENNSHHDHGNLHPWTKDAVIATDAVIGTIALIYIGKKTIGTGKKIKERFF